ncbi:hypothetical protein OJJOAM_000046 [Cupriavidus sp. H18C1]
MPPRGGDGPARSAPTRAQLRERYGDKLRWLVLVTLMIGTMSSIVSSTIVNVAVPDLSRHFGLGQERAQWVAASFMIAMTLAMLLTPWLLNRYGLRRTFLGAAVLLGGGGLVGGFSPSYGVMIAMRVAEGVAAGIMQPLPNILILRVFEEREQGRAMGMFGFGVVLAPALGPSLGGFLVESFGWRSIFFVVVPLTIVAGLMARRFMAIDSAMMGERKPLDWQGLALAGVATVMLLNGLVELREDTVTGLLLSGLGVLLLVLFVLWQLRASDPLMNMRLYSYRQFSAGAVVAFIYGAGLFGSTYLLPVYMQMALQYSPSQAGFVLLPAGDRAGRDHRRGRPADQPRAAAYPGVGGAGAAGRVLPADGAGLADDALCGTDRAGGAGPRRPGLHPAVAVAGRDAGRRFLADRAGLQRDQLRAAVGWCHRRQLGRGRPAMAAGVARRAAGRQSGRGRCRGAHPRVRRDLPGGGAGDRDRDPGRLADPAAAAAGAGGAVAPDEVAPAKAGAA